MLVGVQVEHELPDGALQPRQALLQYDKARAREFRRGLEIHEAERSAEVVMWLRRKAVLARLAEHVMLHVAVLVDAVGHLRRGQRQVWDRGQQLSQLVIGGF